MLGSALSIGYYYCGQTLSSKDSITCNEVIGRYWTERRRRQKVNRAREKEQSCHIKIRGEWIVLLSLSCTTWETQDGPADGSEYIRTNIYYTVIKDQVILLLLREKSF